MRLAGEITIKGDKMGQKLRWGMWSISVVDGETSSFGSMSLHSGWLRW